MTTVTTLPAGAFPSITGCVVVMVSFAVIESIVKADWVAWPVSVAVGVGVRVRVRVGVRVADGVAVGVGVGVTVVPVVEVPLIVIFAPVVPVSTFAVVSFIPPTNVLDAN